MLGAKNFLVCFNFSICLDRAVFSRCRDSNSSSTNALAQSKSSCESNFGRLSKSANALSVCLFTSAIFRASSHESAVFGKSCESAKLFYQIWVNLTPRIKQTTRNLNDNVDFSVVIFQIRLCQKLDLLHIKSC